jgi:hypothetical protein
MFEWSTLVVNLQGFDRRRSSCSHYVSATKFHWSTKLLETLRLHGERGYFKPFDSVPMQVGAWATAIL